MGKSLLLLDAGEDETQLAVVEAGQLNEFLAEKSQLTTLVGSVFKGKVRNVRPGMQAAFVDIGLDKAAYLPVGEQESPVTEGQMILLQIEKDPVGTKGPRATRKISLPGSFVVWMPDHDYVGVSHRIAPDSLRERLRQTVESLRPQDVGLIVRTAAVDAEPEDLAQDIAHLALNWQTLLLRASHTTQPGLLYREYDLPIRMVRDYFSDQVEAVWIKGKTAYQRVREIVSERSEQLAERIHLYEGAMPLFARYGVADAIAAIGSRRVDLPCGGYLVIDPTEALTVVDVNTGRYTGETSLAETAFLTNCQAAVEIGRQVRLRDIGGIIVVDFIDLHDGKNRDEIIRLLETAFAGDRMKARVLGWTPAGLVEINRKKSRRSAATILYDVCPVCDGTGKITAASRILQQIRQQLAEQGGTKPGQTLLLEVPPRIIPLFDKRMLTELESRYAVQLRVQANPSMQPEAFSLLWDRR